WATLETRRRKDRAETTAAALARWEDEVRDQLGRALDQVWKTALSSGADEPGHVPPTADKEVLADAVGAVDGAKATWTRYDLAREITLRLDRDPSLDAAGQLARIDRLVDAAVGQQACELGLISLAAEPVFTTPGELRRV